MSSSASQALKDSPTGVTIDIMRGLLAFMVLVAHALESACDLHGLPLSSLPPLVAASLGHGGFWVGGFFVLSGFCVHRAVMGMRLKDHAGLYEYGLARFSRLYPLYLVALLMAALAWFLLGPFIPSEREDGMWRFLQHLVMLQGVTGSVHELKPAWSLTYEVVYYFAWPVLLIAGGWSVRRALVIGFPVAILLAGGLLGVWKVLLLEPTDSLLMPMGLISAQFVLWLGGAWLAQSWEALLKHVKRGFAWAGLAGVLVCYGANGVLLHVKAPLWSQLLAGYAAVPCWLALIWGSHAWTGLLRWKRTAAWLGLLSYPLYIMHQVVLDALVGPGRDWSFLTSLPLALAAFLMLGGVMLFMAVIGVPLEAGLLRWRSRWLKRVYKKAEKLAADKIAARVIKM